MSETFWLESSDISFPLAPAAMLLTDPDSSETPTYTEAAEIISNAFAELSLTGLVIDIENARAHGRTPFVSLAQAHNNDEWGSLRGLVELLETLAPIIPDGAFAIVETSDPEARQLRYIIADDKTITDAPTLVWDPISGVIENLNTPTPQERPVVIEFSLTRSFKLDGYVQVPGAHAADEDKIIALIDQAYSAGELDGAHLDESKQYTGIELGDVVTQSSHPPAAKFTTEDFE